MLKWLILFIIGYEIVRVLLKREWRNRNYSETDGELSEHGTYGSDEPDEEDVALVTETLDLIDIMDWPTDGGADSQIAFFRQLSPEVQWFWASSKVVFWVEGWGFAAYFRNVAHEEMIDAAVEGFTQMGAPELGHVILQIHRYCKAQLDSKMLPGDGDWQTAVEGLNLDTEFGDQLEMFNHGIDDLFRLRAAFIRENQGAFDDLNATANADSQSEGPDEN
ncbi:MAG: hypothetical protein JXR76_12350 [Deltaproteobacteria bacterium]|nr:hypothetical protein [Deltaproteobacteria bacterium]